MKRIAASAVVALSLMAGGAQAAIVTYNFNVKDFSNPSAPNLVGVFSYDDTATSSGTEVDGSSVYQAISMSLSGLPGTNPILGVGNDNAGNGTLDIAFFEATFNTTLYRIMMIFPGATFSSTAANQMNGRAFGDLAIILGGVSSVAYVNSNITATGINSLLSLSQSSANVPGPATAALLGLGLVSFGAARRKKA